MKTNKNKKENDKRNNDKERKKKERMDELREAPPKEVVSLILDLQ